MNNTIGPDASDDGSKMNDDVWPLIVEHTADTAEIAQIIFGEICDKDIFATTVFAKSANEVSPEKTPASSNGNSLRSKIDQSLSPNQGFFGLESCVPHRER